MEYQKITKLLGSTLDKVPRFITKKWIEVYDQSGGTCNTNKQIRFKTSMLRSDLCDYSDAYILVEGKITVRKGRNNNDNNNAYDNKLAFKNNAPFIYGISKINDKLIENAEDLDVVMLMHNLLEHSKNYRKTTGSLFNYYRDEPNSGTVGDGANTINYSIKDSKSCDYKTSITGKFEGNNVEKDVEIAIPLKYLSNFWRNLDMPLINCEISLTLFWYEKCVLTSRATKIARAANPDNNPPIPLINAVNNPINAVFKITDCKLYVPVVTLSSEEDNELLNELKSGFKRPIKWNKYMSQMSNQTANNNLNYLIDPTFGNVNRLFVLSFEIEEDRISFSNYDVPKVEIKDYNVIADGKPFFEIPVKNKEESYEKIIEISRNSGYTTGNLLDYEYFKDHYKLIAIDLSKQSELEDSDIRQKINFIGRLEQNATMFFIIEKKEETTIVFLQNSATIV